MIPQDITGLASLGILLVIGLVFGIQFYRLDKVTRELDILWKELEDKLDKMKGKQNV